MLSKINFKKWQWLFIFLIIAIPSIILAEVVARIYYPLLNHTNNFQINARQSDGSVASTTVCINNESSNDYFVPNNTKNEIDKFIVAVGNNTVPGVSIPSICVNKVCEISNGENSFNNPLDCTNHFCGDGVCNGDETCVCSDCPACKTDCTNGDYDDCPQNLMDKSDCMAMPNCIPHGCFAIMYSEYGPNWTSQCTMANCHLLDETNCVQVGGHGDLTGCFWPLPGDPGPRSCHFRDWARITDMNQCIGDGYSWYYKDESYIVNAGGTCDAYGNCVLDGRNIIAGNLCYENSDFVCKCAP